MNYFEKGNLGVCQFDNLMIKLSVITLSGFNYNLDYCAEDC